MSITATIEVSHPSASLDDNHPTAVLNKLEMFGNWILIDGTWNDNGVWYDEVILGRDYLTEPVDITSIELVEHT
jgi:hypothetical protein